MKGSQRPPKVGGSGTDAIVRREFDTATTGKSPLTAATGFKRLGIVLLAVIAAGAGVLTTAGYLISPDAVRARCSSDIRTVTGLNPSCAARPTSRCFPTAASASATSCSATPASRRSPPSG